MRVVSDFLDRMATRAIGSESMLSPRLPSLFEPAGRGRAGVVEESFQIEAASPVERALEPTPSHISEADNRVVRADAPVPALALRPAKAAPLQATPRERTKIVDDARQAAPSEPSRRDAVAEPVSSRVMPRAEQAPVGELQRVRETHVLHERMSAEPAHDDRSGVLLPPNQPVFATQHEPEARPATATSRTATGSIADARRETQETVVHVSIGRLEVRAAPAGAAAPRRQEAPRTSALDDYLRQRGGQKP